MPDALPAELKKEEWGIVGVIGPKRLFPSIPAKNWIAVWGFRQGKPKRIVSDRLPNPDGQEMHVRPLAYNEGSRVLICWDYIDGFTDVWVYHVPSKQGKWIARKRWRDVSSFAWSEDGRKLAFTASGLPMMGEPRRGCVYIYDITASKLTQLADDGAVKSDRRTPSPTWTKDGRYLYYTSIARKLRRIDLTTLRNEALPLKADSILAVRGKEIVYWKCVPARRGRGTQKVIVKSTLDPVQGESDAAVVYEGWDLQHTIVSPTGRFVVTLDRCGWRAVTVLIDTDARKSYWVYPHIPSDFDLYGASFSGRKDHGKSGRQGHP